MANNQAEQAIYNRLVSAPTFHPVTADLFLDDWGLDAGDVVTVRADNTDYTVPVYNMNLNWNGTTRAQIQSTGNEKRKPLSALRRRQYHSMSSAHQWVDEQGQTISTEFIQVKDQIGFVVKIKDGEYEVDAAHVVAGINNQDKTSTSYVDIMADKINLTGYVTATTLDARLLNVDRLFANTGYAGTLYLTGNTGISANGAINAGSVSAGTVSASTLKLISGDDETTVNHKAVTIGGQGVANLGLLGTGSTGTLAIPDAVSNLQITLSGNTYTLQKKTFSSNTWADVGTFSRATTLTGAWSSGKYTVSASPQGASNTTEITVSGHWGNGTTELATTYYGSVSGTVDGVVRDTGKTFAVNALALVGISDVKLNGPATGAYVDGEDKGTLTGDRYYQVEATPVNGQKVYIKFKTPASSTGKGTVTAITTTTIDSDDVKTSGIAMNVSGTNLNSFAGDSTFSLVSTTFVPDPDVSTQMHCVNLRHGNAVIGRINIEAVYTSGYSTGYSAGESAGEAKFTPVNVRECSTSGSIKIKGYTYFKKKSRAAGDPSPASWWVQSTSSDYDNRYYTPSGSGTEYFLPKQSSYYQKIS